MKVHAKRFAKLRLAYKRLKLLVKMCIFCVTAQKITTEYNQLFFGCCNQGLVKCLGCNISSAQISDQHIFYSHVFSKKIAKLIFTFSSYLARVGFFNFFTAQKLSLFLLGKNPHHIEVLQNLPVSPAASQWHWKLAPWIWGK